MTLVFFFFFQFITFFFQTETESFEKNVSISNLLLMSSLSKIYMLSQIDRRLLCI